MILAQREWQFSLRDLIGVVVILAILLAIAAPMLGAWRESARQNTCMNNLKVFGLLCQNYSQPHDSFPLASNYRHGLVVPGKNDPGLPSAIAANGGYSWLVSVAPHYSTDTLSLTVKQGSNNFQVEPFANQCRHSNGVPFWRDALDLSRFCRCPSFSGDRFCTGSQSPTRYQNEAPMLMNYLAIVGSHYDPTDPSGIVQDGVIVGVDAFGRSNSCHGIKPTQITDGQDRTLLFCESREATYAGWYDGSTAWTVGQPDNSNVVTPVTGYVLSNGSPALNYGPDEAHPDRFYFRAGGPYFGLIRRWGPSSMHPGGRINVVYTGCHCVTLNASEMDPNIWMHMITREGAEIVTGSEDL